MSRRWRTALAVVFCLALGWGSVWGDDDHFPIGPLRMYATRQRLDTTVSWYEIRTVDGVGAERTLGTRAMGMRRSEIEGQRPRLVEEPHLLCRIAATAGASDAVEVRLVRAGRRLEDGRPVGPVTHEVVTTCRP